MLFTVAEVQNFLLIYTILVQMLPGLTYSKLPDIRGLTCEKFNFRKLGVIATEIAILKENRVRLTFTLTMLSRLCY